jgi:hypothetical protein
MLLLLVPVAAQAQDETGTENYKTELQSVKPAVSGLDVRTEGGDRYLFVKNGTGKTVAVSGYDDEPYLRFLPSGVVEANANSPAKYLNGIRFGTPDSVQIPISALSAKKPKWQKVSDNGSYRWFDHRIHWMEKKPPPVVKDQSKRTKIFDWKVPATVGATPVTLAGTLSWVPTASDSSGVSGGAIAAIVAGVLVLMALAAVLIRRRREPEATDGAPAGERPGGREKATKEAW